MTKTAVVKIDVVYPSCCYSSCGVDEGVKASCWGDVDVKVVVDW